MPDQRFVDKSGRLKWNADLHHKFELAVRKFGIKTVLPTQILKEMDVQGLTRHHISSHLQKFRFEKYGVKRKKDISGDSSLLLPPSSSPPSLSTFSPSPPSPPLPSSDSSATLDLSLGLGLGLGLSLGLGPLHSPLNFNPSFRSLLSLSLLNSLSLELSLS